MIKRELLIEQGTEQKWLEAYDHLFNQSHIAMHNGLMGISKFVHYFLPLWDRFDAGERTENLLEEMNSAAA